MEMQAKRINLHLKEMKTQAK